MNIGKLLGFMVNSHLYAKQSEYFLLLSHMRCYTSLLGHIFGSNPDIAGYAELHMQYVNRFDFFRMKKRIHELVDKNSRGKKIWFDKLLHNHCYVSPNIARRDNVHIIATIRKPEATLTSIRNMGWKYHDVGWYKDQERVTQYYVTRLGVITENVELFTQGLGKKVVFFEAENLIKQPDIVLKKLTEALNLSVPLEKEYKTFSSTGMPGLGDPSEAIKYGKIIEKNEQYGDREAFDSHLLDLANLAYRTALRVIRKNCVVIG